MIRVRRVPFFFALTRIGLSDRESFWVVDHLTKDYSDVSGDAFVPSRNVSYDKGKGPTPAIYVRRAVRFPIGAQLDCFVSKAAADFFRYRRIGRTKPAGTLEQRAEAGHSRREVSDTVSRYLLIVVNCETQAAMKVFNAPIVEGTKILEQSSLFRELLEGNHVRLAAEKSL